MFAQRVDRRRLQRITAGHDELEGVDFAEFAGSQRDQVVDEERVEQRVGDLRALDGARDALGGHPAAGHDHGLPVHHERRQGEALEGAGVVERTGRHCDGLSGEAPLHGLDGGEPHDIVMGPYRPLRSAGRSGGVHDHDRIISGRTRKIVDTVIGAGEVGFHGPFGYRSVVVLEAEPGPDREVTANRIQLVTAAGVKEDHLAPRVLDEEGQFRGSEPEVQADRDRAEAGDREVQGDVVEGVQQDDSDPVALDDPGVPERCHVAIAAGAEIGVGPPCCSVDRHRGALLSPRGSARKGESTMWLMSMGTPTVLRYRRSQ